MRKLFYLVAASLVLSSCLENKVIEAYNEDFENVFGATDPNHTWKMVENQEVEVSLDKPSRVKIYVNSGDDTYRLAADYENVTGTQTLSYDAPMGCEDIDVTVNGVPIREVNSRSITTPKVTVGNELDITYGDVYYFHTHQELIEREDNRGKVNITSCKFKSSGKGTYLFYPIYWGGIFKHSYGLYYLDENGVKQDCDPFFTNKEGEINPLKMYNESTGQYEAVTANFVKNLFQFPAEGTELTDDEKNKVVLKSPCFAIQIEPGTVFGFYVDIYQNSGLPTNPYIKKARYYSDPEWNVVTPGDNKPFSAFAYMHNDGVNNASYITIEDDKNDDFDYNDFIFMLYGVHEHYDDTPMQYIYAVEDLGGTNDFDFNDVVFSVSHVKGKENATVQPLAKGGIYEAEICFNKQPYAKVHEKFGVASTVMVNTKAGTTKENMKKAEPFLVPVGANWSHTEHFTNNGNGFSVAVTLPKKDKVITTCGPGSGDAPQMLVLTDDWMWPTETTSISEAYKGFGEWGANYTNKIWISDFISDLVVNWK